MHHRQYSDRRNAQAALGVRTDCKLVKGLGLLLALLALTLIPARVVCAESTLDEFRQSVAELEKWLNSSDYGVGWKSFLRFEELKRQADLGYKADINVLRQLLTILERDEPGLELWRFVATKGTLAAWLAEMNLPPIEKLSGRVLEATEEFNPITKDDVAKGKSDLERAIRSFESFMSRSIPSRARNWYSYLRWGRFKGLLLSEKPNLRELNEILQLYYQDHQGLEMKQYRDVRVALREYMNLVLFSNYRTADTYEAEMQQLAKNLVDHVQSPSSDTALQIGRSIGFLHRARQAPDIVESVRYHYSRPNFYAHVSARMLNSMVARPVSETTPVRENILGTSVSGTANTQGQIGLSLLPSSGSALLRLQLRATTTSNNVGQNGPVTIRSRGVTNTNAQTLIRLDQNGLSSGVATARCNTSSSILGINARFRLMARMAQRQVYERKGQADRIASQRAERRFANKLDSQVRPQVSKTNQDFLNKIRYPLIRQDAWPDSIQFFSDPSRLYTVILQADNSQISANSEPPQVAGAPDISLRTHETYVSNFSQALIGGEEMTDEELAKLVQEWFGRVPEELQRGEDQDPWAITFDEFAPFRATFEGNLVTIGLRGRRFTRGDQTLRRGIEISATYRLDKSGPYIKLIRVDKVDVSFIRRSRSQTLSQIAFKTFLRKKFTALFKPEFEFDGSVQLPGTFRQLGPMRLTHFDTQNGWLSLNWIRPTGGPIPAGRTYP